MSFYMWLFAVKHLADSYSEAINRYREMDDEEKLRLHDEFCREQAE